MNIFRKLTKNLINKKLWASKIDINLYRKDKDINNNIIYTLYKTYNNIPCISKLVDKKYISDKILASFKQFDISSLQITDLNLIDKIQIIFNGNKYIVKQIFEDGIVNNASCIIKLITEG